MDGEHLGDEYDAEDDQCVKEDAHGHCGLPQGAAAGEVLHQEPDGRHRDGDDEGGGDEAALAEVGAEVDDGDAVEEGQQGQRARVRVEEEEASPANPAARAATYHRLVPGREAPLDDDDQLHHDHKEQAEQLVDQRDGAAHADGEQRAQAHGLDQEDGEAGGQQHRVEDVSGCADGREGGGGGCLQQPGDRAEEEPSHGQQQQDPHGLGGALQGVAAHLLVDVEEHDEGGEEAQQGRAEEGEGPRVAEVRPSRRRRRRGRHVRGEGRAILVGRRRRRRRRRRHGDAGDGAGEGGPVGGEEGGYSEIDLKMSQTLTSTFVKTRGRRPPPPECHTPALLLRVLWRPRPYVDPRGGGRGLWGGRPPRVVGKQVQAALGSVPTDLEVGGGECTTVKPGKSGQVQR